MLNQLIGKYRITRFIGEGGMANVYEGTHVTLGTKAAVKILNPLLAKNEQFRQRFQNEAAFMASLDHPNITKVFDFEDDENHLAIVMELLEGMDLNEWVKQKGAFSFETFKPIFDQILQAFQYAHHKGILHRDIKPSNIFIDNNGKVKILDFGIAKLFGTGNEMTQTGTQMGTPAYMSPEQVRAEKSIDHRSDIYSLGITLYFALAGSSPYDAENESQFDIFNKIVFNPLPELSSNEFANAIIKKACEKDRALRFQSVEEIKIRMHVEKDDATNGATSNGNDFGKEDQYKKAEWGTHSKKEARQVTIASNQKKDYSSLENRNTSSNNLQSDQKKKESGVLSGEILIVSVIVAVIVVLIIVFVNQIRSYQTEKNKNESSYCYSDSISLANANTSIVNPLA
jgi:serine/threonine protein kinase